MVRKALLCALKRYEDELATPRTIRYYLEGLGKEKVTVDGAEWKKRYVELVHTFLVLMTKRTRSSTIEVNGERYQVQDYEFPGAWWLLANARRVYVSPNCIAVAKPYFDFEYSDDSIETLDPFEVRTFFTQYNGHQLAETKIVTRGPSDGFNDPVTLLDFKALCSEDGRLAWFNSAGGTIDPMTTQVLGVEHFVEDENLMTFDQYEERSVSRWLMSVDGVKSEG